MTRQATAAEQTATALQITALHDLAELLRRQLDDVRDDRVTGAAWAKPDSGCWHPRGGFRGGEGWQDRRPTWAGT